MTSLLVEFREKFLTLALAQGVITKNERGRIFLSPHFGGRARLLQLAALSCRQVINSQEQCSEADVLMTFDGPDYPLLPAVAMTYLPSDAKDFVGYGFHHKYPRDFFRGKKVLLLGTLESETEIRGAKEYIESSDYGGVVVGAVMLFSESFSRAQNDTFGIPIVRVIEAEDIIFKEAIEDVIV